MLMESESKENRLEDKLVSTSSETRLVRNSECSKKMVQK
jgi:hypothetical protein